MKDIIMVGIRTNLLSKTKVYTCWWKI